MARKKIKRKISHRLKKHLKKRLKRGDSSKASGKGSLTSIQKELESIMKSDPKKHAKASAHEKTRKQPEAAASNTKSLKIPNLPKPKEPEEQKTPQTEDTKIKLPAMELKGEDEKKRPLIETRPDQLYKIVNTKGSLLITKAAKEFNVDLDVVEKWANVLEEHKLIDIHYPTFGDATLYKTGTMKKIMKKESKSDKDESKKLTPDEKKKRKKKKVGILLAVIAIVISASLISYLYVPGARSLFAGDISSITTVKVAGLPVIYFIPLVIILVILLIAIMKKGKKPKKSEKKEKPKENKKPAMQKGGKRPKGVTIISILGFLSSFTMLGLGTLSILMYGFAGIFAQMLGPLAAVVGQSIGGVFLIVGVLNLALGAMGLAAFALLLKMKRVGFFLTFGLGVASIAVSLIFSGLSGIPTVVFFAIVMLYLFKKKDIFT